MFYLASYYKIVIFFIDHLSNEWSHSLHTKSFNCQSLSNSLHSEMIDLPGLRYTHIHIWEGSLITSSLYLFFNSSGRYKALFPLILNFESHYFPFINLLFILIINQVSVYQTPFSAKAWNIWQYNFYLDIL